MLLSIVVVVIIFRAQSDTIVLREFINPDEGELLAGGRRAAMSFIPFKDFTSYTYGPLWPFTLGWLHRIGMPLTIPVAHLLNSLLSCSACIILARTIWKRWNLALAASTVIPIAIHWSKGFYNQDFYSLSTETLPFAFLVAGCVVAFPHGPITQRRAVVAAMLFGSAVWSKYAFAILIAVALLSLLLKMWSSGLDIKRSIFTCVIGPIVPIATLVFWAILYLVPVAKIFETFAISTSYLGTGGLTGSEPTLADRIEATRLAASMFRSMLPLTALLTAALIAGVVHTGIGKWRVQSLKELPFATLFRVLAVVSVAASLLSLGVLIPIFPHYTYLFIAGVFQATFLLASLEPVPLEAHRHSFVLSLASTAAIAMWALPPILERPEFAFYRWSRGAEARTTWKEVLSPDGGLWDRANAADGRPLSTLCPVGSKTIVWGWSPDLYSQYGWKPATRYVISIVAIRGPKFTTNYATYRDRMLIDFRNEDPACVIDAAIPAMFPSWGPEISLDQQWPEFVTELSASYTRNVVFLHGKSPFSVWVRNP